MEPPARRDAGGLGADGDGGVHALRLWVGGSVGVDGDDHAACHQDAKRADDRRRRVRLIEAKADAPARRQAQRPSSAAASARAHRGAPSH